MNDKPKVCIIADIPNWAFDSQVKGLIRNSKLNINYTLVYMNDAHKINTNNFDVIFPMGMLGATTRLYNDILKPKYPGFVTLCHHYPWNPGIPEKNITQELIDNELVVMKASPRHGFISKRLQKVWADGYGIKSYYLPSGIDTEWFKPTGLFKSPGNINIGWIGNKTKLVKRFHTIVKPAVDRIMSEFPNVNFVTKGYENLVPHNEMPKLYRDIDLYVSGSSHDGLPTPLVEASACGIPYVACRVGVVDEIDIAGLNIIVEQKNTTVDTFYNAIKQMIKNKPRMRQAGAMNRKAIMAGWSWQEIAAEIWEYFIINWPKCLEDTYVKREAALDALKVK